MILPFLLLAWMLSPVFAGDGPQFRGPELNGISRETNWITAWPTAGFKPLGRANVGTGFGAVAVAAGGRFIALSDRGELMWSEISSKSFAPKARAQVLGGKCWTPPALANGLLYCRNGRGEIVSIDLNPPLGKTP